MRRIFTVLGVVFTMQICLSEEVRLAPIALGGSSSSAVQSPATVKVRGKGVGVTKAEALKDAYRDAVERAVGLFVDAEQFVKNDELIKDQILTQSNAYIKKCHLVYGCAKRYIEWRTFEFQSDDIAKIASVTIELAE